MCECAHFRVTWSAWHIYILSQAVKGSRRQGEWWTLLGRLASGAVVFPRRAGGDGDRKRGGSGGRSCRLFRVVHGATVAGEGGLVGAGFTDMNTSVNCGCGKEGAPSAATAVAYAGAGARPVDATVALIEPDVAGAAPDGPSTAMTSAAALSSSVAGGGVDADADSAGGVGGARHGHPRRVRLPY